MYTHICIYIYIYVYKLPGELGLVSLGAVGLRSGRKRTWTSCKEITQIKQAINKRQTMKYINNT